MHNEIASGTGDASIAGDIASSEIRERGNGKGRLPPPTAFDEEQDEDSYAAFEQEQQQTMMAEQDGQLDDVSRTVGVLRGQAVDMGRELEEQHGMLEDVDQLADRVGGKLQVGVKKVGEVIRRNEDTVSSCCIAVLIFVLILLLILVIVL
jgi:member of the syntaxin family of t-SNAREs